MKYLEVIFNLTLGESHVKVRVTHEKNEFYIGINDGKAHRIEHNRKCWKTEHRVLVLYIDEIRVAYRDTIKYFKWHLSDKLKSVIYTATIDSTIPCLTFYLEYDIDGHAFHELLKRHLMSILVKPWMPVQIINPKDGKAITFNMGLRPKQAFPQVMPINDKDILALSTRNIEVSKK